MSSRSKSLDVDTDEKLMASSMDKSWSEKNVDFTRTGQTDNNTHASEYRSARLPPDATPYCLNVSLNDNKPTAASVTFSLETFGLSVVCVFVNGVGLSV